MPSPNTDRARKLIVRTTLVTMTTLATVVGAQNLAMLDARQFLATETPVNETAVALAPSATSAPVAVRTTPETPILRAAPSIVILRRASQAPATSSVAGTVKTTSKVQPPSAVQVTAPQPVIIQQPVRQRSSSSR